jgi:protein tyrosine phosphatase (PTP) superfamily phosphohydrolase (DUF442 family)
MRPDRDLEPNSGEAERPGAQRTDPPGTKVRVLRVVGLAVLTGALGYGLVFGVVSVVILGMSQAARGAERDSTQRGAGPAAVSGVPNFSRVDEHLWRGAAPSADGYRRLAGLGVHTVIDLRAEKLPPSASAIPGRAGLSVVRLPVRDGQAPTTAQVTQFMAAVQRARGPVFVHCGAGVGRSGSMAAAYLVLTGQADAATATRRSLAVGPPTLEQLGFMRRLEKGKVARPPLALVALSRIADSPRRSWSRLRG